MPFTPLHMGPALALKPLLQKRFSLMAFGLSQIVIDLEPLYKLIRGDNHHHGWSHTVIGAFLIGLLVTALMLEPSRKLLRLWGRFLKLFRMSWLAEEETLSWRVMLFSAWLGTFSHILLDGFVHADEHPFRPFSLANPFYAFEAWGPVLDFCFWSGVEGSLAYVLWRAFLTFREND